MRPLARAGGASAALSIALLWQCELPGSVRGVQPQGGGEAARPAPAPATAAAPTAPSSDDANAYFGEPRCAAAGTTLCDSFEEGAVGSAPAAAQWKTVLSGAGSTVLLDDARAARGRQSVHVHVGNQGYAQGVVTPVSGLPLSGGVLWGRAFVYFASAGALPQMHWTLFEGSGNLPGATTPTLVRYGGQFTHLMANYFGNDQYAHAAEPRNGGWVDETKMPSNRWACFEWMFALEGNQMHLYLDGNEVQKIAIAGISPQCCPNEPWTQPPLSDMRIGWQIYQADSGQPGYDMWMDEVALDAKRIGCSR